MENEQYSFKMGTEKYYYTYVVSNLNTRRFDGKAIFWNENTPDEREVLPFHGKADQVDLTHRIIEKKIEESIHRKDEN